MPGCGLCGSQSVVFPNHATGRTLSRSQTAAFEGLSNNGSGIVVHFFSDPTGGYAESRKKPMVGGNHDDFPFCIVHPKTAQDVSAVLKCCHENGIHDISIYNGGHSTQGMKGSVVIKMSALNQVSVQTGKPAIVTFGGGCTNAHVDTACKPYGVAITSGNASSVGAVGAMLGGGVGYLARWQGLTIDNLVEATVVLANGEIVVANKDENSDLLFALKGGGGNFGVVVEAKVKARLLDFDPSYQVGNLYCETRIVRHGNDKGSFKLFGNGMGASEKVFCAWRDYALKAPDHVSCDCLMPTGGPMVQIYTYKGNHESAKAESQQWKALGKAAVTIAKPQNYYDSIQTVAAKKLDSQSPCPHVFRIAIANSLPDEAVKILMHACNVGRPNNKSIIHVERLGGKIDTPDDGAESSAFAHRGGQFWISMIGVYSIRGRKRNSKNDAKVDAWIEALYNDLRPFAIGQECTGTMGYYDRKTATVIKENAFGGMGDKKIARILGAKKKYDPGNLFRYVENGFSNAANIDPGQEIA